MTEAEEFEFRHRLESEQKAPAVSAPVVAPGSKWDQFVEGVKNPVGKNAVLGAVRGAAGIGATIMQPFQAALDPAGANKDTRAGIEGGLDALGADKSSMAYGAGKLGAEIAGTSGVGGVLAAPVKRLAPAFGNALATGGFRAAETVAPNALAQAANAGTRIAGGALTGAASAGLVNPDDALAGGALGGMLPGAMYVAGKGGNALGRVLRGPEQAPELGAAVNAAREAGYVIPPSQARPTLANRVMEGVAGKITTAQNASAKNAAVTNSLAADAIGLPKDTRITPDVLKTVRDEAGKAYEAVSGSGLVTPPPQYAAALDAIAAPFQKSAAGFPGAKPSPVLDLVQSLRSPSFDAGAAVAKIRELRSAADDGFKPGGNSEVARAAKQAAKALEDALESHLEQIGQPDALKAFQDARTRIAKTYTVEKALNKETGTVDARKLASELQRGKPLSGGLKDAASFAARFPKAAQTPEGMGSLPQTSPLDWVSGGVLSTVTQNPLALLSVGARPLARSAALSGPVQNRLVQPEPMQLIGDQVLSQIPYRGAPRLANDR